MKFISAAAGGVERPVRAPQENSAFGRIAPAYSGLGGDASFSRDSSVHLDALLAATESSRQRDVIAGETTLAELAADRLEFRRDEHSQGSARTSELNELLLRLDARLDTLLDDVQHRLRQAVPIQDARQGEGEQPGRSTGGTEVTTPKPNEGSRDLPEESPVAPREDPWSSDTRAIHNAPRSAPRDRRPEDLRNEEQPGQKLTSSDAERQEDTSDRMKRTITS